VYPDTSRYLTATSRRYNRRCEACMVIHKAQWAAGVEAWSLGSKWPITRTYQRSINWMLCVRYHARVYRIQTELCHPCRDQPILGFCSVKPTQTGIGESPCRSFQAASLAETLGGYSTTAKVSGHPHTDLNSNRSPFYFYAPWLHQLCIKIHVDYIILIIKISRFYGLFWYWA
jgi:hypothetical protein